MFIPKFAIDLPFKHFPTYYVLFLMKCILLDKWMHKQILQRPVLFSLAYLFLLPHKQYIDTKWSSLKLSSKNAKSIRVLDSSCKFKPYISNKPVLFHTNIRRFLPIRIFMWISKWPHNLLICISFNNHPFIHITN